MKLSQEYAQNMNLNSTMALLLTQRLTKYRTEIVKVLCTKQYINGNSKLNQECKQNMNSLSKFCLLTGYIQSIQRGDTERTTRFH